MYRILMTLAAASVAVLPGYVAAFADAPAAATSVQDLLSRALAGAPDREVRLLTVEYAPGGASQPHRHDAQVFVYVLSGSVRMQVAGAAAVTLKAGETFYEGPKDIHVVSENASKTEPAKFLVVMVKAKNAPASRPAALGQS
jgi:quercetin dioxygenase-like cupin family protein